MGKCMGLQGNRTWWDQQEQANTGGMQVEQWGIGGGLCPFPPVQHAGETQGTAVEGDLQGPVHRGIA